MYIVPLLPLTLDIRFCVICELFSRLHISRCKKTLESSHEHPLVNYDVLLVTSRCQNYLALTELHSTWGAAPNCINRQNLKVVSNILEYAISGSQSYLNSWSTIWSIRSQHQNRLVYSTASGKAQVVVGHWISSTCISRLGDIILHIVPVRLYNKEKQQIW